MRYVMGSYELFERHVTGIMSGGGNNQYVALCPFHQDTHQSFSFNSELGLYNCKTCGEEGNAVKFAKLMNEDPTPFYSDDYQPIKNGSKTVAMSDKTDINRHRTDGKQTGNSKRTEGKQKGKPSMDDGRLTVKNGGKTAVDLTDKLNQYKVKYPENKGYESFIQNHVGKDSDGAITFPYWVDGKVVGIKHHKPKTQKTNGELKKSWWDGDGSGKWYNSWYFELYHKDQLIICEGEKDVNRLVQLGYNATSTSGGALSVPPIPDKFNEPKEIILLYDNDDAGVRGAKKCADKIFNSLGVLPYIAHWKTDLPKGFDAYEDTTGEEVEYAINNKTLHTYVDKTTHNNADKQQDNSKTKGLKTMSITELVNSDYEPPEIIASNLVQQESVSIISGCSGVGKSWVALNVGMSIAAGKPLFEFFEVPKTRRVLLAQFELTNGQVKERVEILQPHYIDEWSLISQNFDYVIVDKDNTSYSDKWNAIDEHLNQGDFNGGVVIVDNLYTSVEAGIDISNNTFITPILKKFDEICEKHKVSLIVITHHIKHRKITPIDMDDILGGASFTRHASNILQVKNSKLDNDLRVAMITKVRGEKSELIEIPFKLRYDNGYFIKGGIIQNETLHYIEATDKWEIKLLKEMKDYELVRKSDEWTRDDLWQFLSTKDGWERNPSNETKVTRFINRCVEWGLMSKTHNNYKIIATELSDVQLQSKEK